MAEKKKRNKKGWPCFVARPALPGFGFCGHQHAHQVQAHNCAADHAAREGRTWRVLAINRDGLERELEVVNADD